MGSSAAHRSWPAGRAWTTLALFITAGAWHVEPVSAAPAMQASIDLAAERARMFAADVPVVVMVVSPRMVYALQEWPRMRRAAEAAGFEVVSFRDPRVGDREWQAALAALGLDATISVPRLPDNLLAGVGVQNHFPSSVVLLGAQLHPWPVLGVMPDRAFVALLEARLRQLRGTQ